MNEVVKIAVRGLEILFFAGWAGSLLVLLLAGLEDVGTVFERGPDQTH